MPLAVPCTTDLPFPKMNSILLVLGCCLGFCSSGCPSPAQVQPLPPSLSSPPSWWLCTELSSPDLLWCLQCPGWAPAALCESGASEPHSPQCCSWICSSGCFHVPLERGCLRRPLRKTFFLCKSGFVLSTTSTCCQLGLSRGHSGKGPHTSSLLSTSWSRLLQVLNKQNG